MEVHRYLSTACWHEDHDYCKSMIGVAGEKRPGQCKFCDSLCICLCHEEHGQSENSNGMGGYDCICGAPVPCST